MDITQIAALGILGAVLSVTLKRLNPEIAIIVSVVTGILIFMGVLGQFQRVFVVLRDLSESIKLNENYIGVIVKVIGIAYIAQFGMEMCRDAGEAAIASKIELAGKLLIMVVSIPVITGVIDVITMVLP